MKSVLLSIMMILFITVGLVYADNDYNRYSDYSRTYNHESYRDGDRHRDGDKHRDGDRYRIYYREGDRHRDKHRDRHRDSDEKKGPESCEEGKVWLDNECRDITECKGDTVYNPETYSCEVPTPPTDSDGDGVIDSNDNCPDTPQGVEVDSNGCEIVVTPVDNDNDGFSVDVDCNDNNPNINPNATEILYNGIDENCNGMADDIVDADNDGFNSNVDCNDNDANINPDAIEIVGNGIDENCNGMADDIVIVVDNDNDGVPDDVDQCLDTPAGVQVDATGCEIVDPYTDGHYDNPSCVTCHDTQAGQVHASVHYQWNGPATYMVGGNNEQGKANGAMNTYCGNISGNWEGCAACHIGSGMQIVEVPTPEALADIDCLKCHSAPGKKPTRETCLTCHAKAGGGNALKRGDLALATGNTSDRNYDVHMATTGANLDCISCHTTSQHKIAGKGSDLRPTDLDVEVTCSNCHGNTPHSNSQLDKHTSKVACQTCHIPVYGKNASDTEATEATEIFRTWKSSDATSPPFHPTHEVANNLKPVYRFWNGYTWNYNVGDVPEYDSSKGTYQTSVPQGDSSDPDAKLYPFKYKTVEQPAILGTHQLIPLNTKIFFSTADTEAAIRSGLELMGMSPDTPYEWVTADTYQMLNHQVSPYGQALSCQSCHVNNGPKLQELGYAVPDNNSATCAQCHSNSKARDWSRGNFSDFRGFHDKHRRYSCNRCHSNK